MQNCPFCSILVGIAPQDILAVAFVWTVNPTPILLGPSCAID